MARRQESTARSARARRAQIRELPACAPVRAPHAEHIYAQIIAPRGATRARGGVDAARKTCAKALKATGNTKPPRPSARRSRARAKQQGIEQVAFDRSGFKYHGRVKALADAAREAGLEF